MLGLSRSLSSIPEACLELGAAPSFALSTTAAGETVLVWWRGAVLFAVSCADRASLVTLTSELLASQ
jgi:hypothetical protein